MYIFNTHTAHTHPHTHTHTHTHTHIHTRARTRNIIEHSQVPTDCVRCRAVVDAIERHVGACSVGTRLYTGAVSAITPKLNTCTIMSIDDKDKCQSHVTMNDYFTSETQIDRHTRSNNRDKDAKFTKSNTLGKVKASNNSSG